MNIDPILETEVLNRDMLKDKIMKAVDDVIDLYMAIARRDSEYVKRLASQCEGKSESETRDFLEKDPVFPVIYGIQLHCYMQSDMQFSKVKCSTDLMCRSKSVEEKQSLEYKKRFDGELAALKAKAAIIKTETWEAQNV